MCQTTNYFNCSDWKRLCRQGKNDYQIIVFGGVEDIVGIGENACYQHFVLFSTMFLKGIFLKGIKVVRALQRVLCLPINVHFNIFFFFHFFSFILFLTFSSFLFGKFYDWNLATY